jgi:hypothetical protein
MDLDPGEEIVFQRHPSWRSAGAAEHAPEPRFAPGLGITRTG